MANGQERQSCLHVNHMLLTPTTAVATSTATVAAATSPTTAVAVTAPATPLLLPLPNLL